MVRANCEEMENVPFPEGRRPARTCDPYSVDGSYPRRRFHTGYLLPPQPFVTVHFWPRHGAQFSQCIQRCHLFGFVEEKTMLPEIQGC